MPGSPEGVPEMPRWFERAKLPAALGKLRCAPDDAVCGSPPRQGGKLGKVRSRVAFFARWPHPTAKGRRRDRGWTLALTLALSPRKRIPPNEISCLFTPEPRKETAFLDLDLALNLDRFPTFSRPGFMERAGVRASVLSPLMRVCPGASAMLFDADKG